MIHLSEASLRRGKKLLFEGVTLQAHAGQRMGVVGVNGCGKSSLFSLLLGELETDDGSLAMQPGLQLAHVSQSSPDSPRSCLDFVLDGDAELRELERDLAALQSQTDLDPMDQRLHDIHERMQQIDAWSAPARASRLLHGLGFAAEGMQQAVRECSGGWRMRLVLAQALMCRSDILLLDEPTNHLDLPAILWLENWLRSYQGLLLVISHDREFLDSVCTHIAHMDQQRIELFTGHYSDFEQQHAARLAQQQAMFQKQQKEIAHLGSFVERFRYKASKAKQAQSRLKMIERMSLIAPAHVDSPFRFHFFEPKKQPQSLLSLQRAQAGYNTLPVVSDISIGIQAGSRIGLLGVNGAGKSTLLKALLDGSTLLEGDRTEHPHARIGYFAQHQLEQLHGDCSPLWHVQQQAPESREQELRDHLGRFGFGGEMADQLVKPLSGGEKARLVLCLLVLEKPNLLLLDEPTNHLDLEMRHALSMALIEYPGAVILVSHDRHLLRSVCDGLYIVHDGLLEEFEDDLDAYPAWLQARDSVETGANNNKGVGKKEQRQQAAKQRAIQQPLRRKIRDLETHMKTLRARLDKIDAALADESLYNDDARADELMEITRDRASSQQLLEDHEYEWLALEEQLEQAG